MVQAEWFHAKAMFHAKAQRKIRRKKLRDLFLLVAPQRLRSKKIGFREGTTMPGTQRKTYTIEIWVFLFINWRLISLCPHVRGEPKKYQT